MKKIVLPMIMTLMILLGSIFCIPSTDGSFTSNTPSFCVVATAASKKTATQKKEKYPEARMIWNYLKKMGFNDYVAAGIMGNIMNEVGGNTLQLKPEAYGYKRLYYGICQWSKQYFPSVYGKNLDFQLSFLKKTIQGEFKTFGYKYKKSFNYSSFCKLKDAKAAALAFAKVYERCSSQSYSVRQSNAVKAYNYFVA